MQFKNVFLGRRSIRKYKDKEVPLSLIQEIIDLARFTPSSGNLQNWKMVVVTNSKTKKEIADACLQQTWMEEAPVLIVVCNEYDDVKKHYGKLGKMYSIQNCSNLAFALTLIAYDKGLGSCWVGGFETEALHRILGIPGNMDPEVIISLGYSEETKKPALRENSQYITYFESWGNKIARFPSSLDKLKKLTNIKKHIKKLKK
jgi:nitroreductase